MICPEGGVSPSDIAHDGTHQLQKYRNRSLFTHLDQDFGREWLAHTKEHHVWKYSESYGSSVYVHCMLVVFKLGATAHIAGHVNSDGERDEVTSLSKTKLVSAITRFGFTES